MSRDDDAVLAALAERGAPPGAVDAPPAMSEDALALAFSERHTGQLLYVSALSSWLMWDGCRWKPDDTLHVYDLARMVCRRAAADLDGGKGAKIASAATVAAVERIARSDRHHARRAEDFDADPWSLNTPAGVVDLRTGETRKHRRDDLHTKVTAVAPGGPCPRWLRFLLQISQGDKALVRYLQRFIGYTLTGSTREHVFVFLRGPGGNGKGVLMSTVAAVLGDYATVAMGDIVVQGRNDQHPTHLAALRGARMIQVSEIEQGAPWAEARLKALVAGDRIAARVMHGNPFEFQPTGKFWIAGNHSPVLKNPDPAMRRRLHLVPLTYVPATPDTDLAKRLKAELPGILAWAIRGCLAWQRDGLQPPAVVADASAEYFSEQDSVATWLAERCDRRDVFATALARHLYTDWKVWTAARGEAAGTEKRFSEALQRLVAKKRSNTGIVFLGLSLLLPEAEYE